MIQLNEEQQHAVENAEFSLLCDPRTDKKYVLIPAEMYAQMRAIIDGATKRAGWDDPTLDDYEQYRKSV